MFYRLPNEILLHIVHYIRDIQTLVFASIASLHLHDVIYADTAMKANVCSHRNRMFATYIKDIISNVCTLYSPPHAFHVLNIDRKVSPYAIWAFEPVYDSKGRIWIGDLNFRYHQETLEAIVYSTEHGFRRSFSSAPFHASNIFMKMEYEKRIVGSAIVTIISFSFRGRIELACLAIAAADTDRSGFLAFWRTRKV